MRPAVLIIMAIFVGAPALLMLFSQGRPLAQRIAWAIAIFVTPFLVIALVHMVPALNGEALHNQQAWRALGVFLSTASFILPWVLFAWARGR
jgi:formate hydrogenlyase subunit 3/multisubunit Na+/H+ antiporter MnhD subunit